MTNDIENKLSELLKETYKRENSAEYTKDSGLKVAVTGSYNEEIERYAKKCKEIYIPKFIELFKTTPIENMFVCLVKRIAVDKVKIIICIDSISLNGLLPEDLIEDNEIDAVKKILASGIDGMRFIINFVTKSMFFMIVETTYDKLEEMLGSDIVDEINKEIRI